MRDKPLSKATFSHMIRVYNIARQRGILVNIMYVFIMPVHGVRQWFLTNAFGVLLPIY